MLQKTETVDGITSLYVYAYDDADRLLTVTKDGTLTEEYRCNAAGFRVYEKSTRREMERNPDYDAEGRLLPAEDNVYDEDGYLTQKSDASGTTLYDYSSRGELLSVILPDGTSVEYLHDPTGRRVAKKVNGEIIEKYLWAGHNTTLLAVYDGNDSLLMRFEYADGRMPYAVTVTDGTKYCLACDQIGSLKAVADSAGNVVKKIEYDSFGSIIAESDSDPSPEIPFGFAGGLHDRDTGLVRFGYRDYDPDTGRWTAKDPIGFAGGDTDLYAYCGNDPVNGVDPDGLKVIKFQDLWDSHPAIKGNENPCSTGGKPNFSNQCAIRLGVALEKNGINTRIILGVRNCWQHKKAKASHPLSAQELANGLTIFPINGIGKVIKINPKNFSKILSGKTGIIFFKDYWVRSDGSRSGDHIDLWNGSRLTDMSSWIRIHLRFSVDGFWSDFRKSKEVWFWEIK